MAGVNTAQLPGLDFIRDGDARTCMRLAVAGREAFPWSAAESGRTAPCGEIFAQAPRILTEAEKAESERTVAAKSLASL